MHMLVSYLMNVMSKLMRMRSAVHVSRIGENKNAYRILVGRPKSKRPVERWILER
jgi:hypothetical protein